LGLIKKKNIYFNKYGKKDEIHISFIFIINRL